ncbi:DDE-type integrase/transposase/recombinase [Geobacillus sp. 44B]|uniref:Uncharacterized protein n=1 Tax=Saccharococcus caldoxylosilyticus TaxID=81408 RepID=A0A150LVJ5_9BACL|nr:hypothetical protein B4119_2383 [Parageobacillus caldoxylosilyticus]QNU37536.1 DDE-type integrase/transposase/recombinase [Geobacillus sp. 44B]
MFLIVDKHLAYRVAIQQLKNNQKMSEAIQIRQIRHLNNIVEQDRRCN